MLTKTEGITKLNRLGKERQPFSFYCDFLGEKWCIEEDVVEPLQKTFQLKIGEGVHPESDTRNLSFSKNPPVFSDFQKPFKKVVKEINFGNSFLTNLTFQTPIQTNLSLDEIYHFSRAKYQLLVPDQFVVFSPETFVKITRNKIYSYPMKGTIGADISNAEAIILKDQKEIAEHITIVDLIRNDLSRIAGDVTVSKFRYIEEIKTNQKHLLQVSSEISGTLPLHWMQNLGDILCQLLPAGSVSGAPKPETIRIIREVESYSREFYTGICGHFDGNSLDTGVMIRFIKKVNDQLFFCSGGGITSFSEAKKEYREMVDKIYLAF
ncbi:MAG: aminodeoxychorismate synthase component I [Ekhidna sp.]|nr:aminodeoxychorismate synthase component I [Ekhidna sp.]